VRVGQYGDFPVFERTRDNKGLIFVPAREGLIAPYRLKP
jgi:glycerol kinase